MVIETKSTKKPLIKKTNKDTFKKPLVIDKKSFDRSTDRKNNMDKDIIINTVDIEKISESKIKIVKKEANTKKVKNNSNNGFYATGKRKNAIAKVWLKKGSGNIKINNLEALIYLKRPILEVMINTPFSVTDTKDKFDVVCNVLGGGLSGQAGAIKHGIAKAMLSFNSEAYRKNLKAAGLLTRDSRVVERKKPGLKKARKGQVFSKR